MKNFDSFANGGITKIKPYQAGKPIEEVQRELSLKSVIKLASNENPYGMSKKAIKECTKALRNCHFYPDSHGYYLKQKLIETFSYKEECITLGDGSNELINLLFQAFINDKVNVVIPKYSFVVYNMEAIIANAKVKITDLKDYVVDTKKILEAIDNDTRMVVIANPANPTGTALSSSEIYDFIKKVPKDVFVVLDEAYNEFIEDENYVDSASYLKEFSNLIICRTFSKAYGLAGLRIGYMLSNESVASIINRVRAPFNVNSIAQIAAINALDDKEHLAYVVKRNNQERKRFLKYCKKHKLYMIPSQANFVSIDFKCDTTPIYDALLHKGVIVRPLAPYGLNTILRVSIGTKTQNTIFFKALDEILNG